MYKAKELRDQSLVELETNYHDACKRLFDAINKFKSEKKRDNPQEIKSIRKDIARLLTVMTEKRRQKLNESH